MTVEQLACSIHGCTGSAVSIELFVRVTSVTGGGLVSNRITVSESFLVKFHNSTNASDGMVFYRIIAKLPV